jgi:hypothetical protein
MSLARMARIAAAPTINALSVEDVPKEGTGAQLPVPPDGSPMPQAVPPTPQALPASATNSGVNKSLSTVAAFIPSEALALYVALLGVFIGTSSDREYAAKWFIFALGLAVTCLAIFDGYVSARRVHAANPETTPAPSLGRFVKIVVFALIAFTIYVMAMPDNPFEQLANDSDVNINAVSGVLALLAGFVLPMVASWLGVPARDAEPS